MNAYLLVNFGGPRSTAEIAPFLSELLCDRDVVPTNLPNFLHRLLFRRIARKRAVKIAPDYEKIGGGSPIFFDTEELANRLRPHLDGPLFTFHRYLPATHKDSLQALEKVDAPSIHVLPLFPQFSYSTTGSIARFFAKRLSALTEKKLSWIPSYPAHPGFVGAFQNRIRSFLAEKHLKEEECILLFSAHGLPLVFIEKGDPYQKECEASFQAIAAAFPKAKARLSYQSKFGKGEWLKPYTEDVCKEILSWNEGKTQVVFLPLSFPSDHIETLFEVEEQYLPLIEERGLKAHRCPALNFAPDWIETTQELLKQGGSAPSRELFK